MPEQESSGFKATWEWARHIGYELDGSARTVKPPGLRGETIADKAAHLAETLTAEGPEAENATEAARALEQLLRRPEFNAASAARVAHHLADLLRLRAAASSDPRPDPEAESAAEGDN
jgi:hypothetical protein